MTLDLHEHPDGVTLDVRIVPNARSCGLAWTPTGELRLRIDAPAVDGAANKKLLRWLARTVLGVSRSDISLLRGERSRTKTLLIRRSPNEVRAALHPYLDLEGTGE